MFQAPPEAPKYVLPQPGGMRLPTWLLALLFAVGFAGVGGGIFWLIAGHSPKTSAAIENPDAKAAAKVNPLQQYIEITGLRFSALDKGGVQVAFIVVNHSDADIIGLTGTATIKAKTQKAEEDPVGTVPFQLSMPAQSSKELTLPLTTKLKIVDMPDWQNVVVNVLVTSPPGA
jgi:hypothetical protein